MYSEIEENFINEAGTLFLQNLLSDSLKITDLYFIVYFMI